MLRVACPRENAGGSDRFPKLLQPLRRASGPGSDGSRPPPPGLREPARLVFCYEVPTGYSMRFCIVKFCLATFVAGAAFSGHISHAMWDRTSESLPGAQLSESEIENIRPNHSFGVPVGADQPADSVRSDRLVARNCSSLARAAAVHDIPLAFFTRLIRQESNFNSKAVSRAGAQGIAQFMPATALWRGLSDPFEPTQALLESARWLHELQAEFGNLGLAAAAYNAGPRRVKDWVGGRGKLPNETRAYVRAITGRTAEEWISTPRETQISEVANDCGEIEKQSVFRPSQPAVTREQPAVANLAYGIWAVHLVGDASENRALMEYPGLQQRYRSVLGGRAPIIVKRPIGGRRPSTWYFVRVAESSHEKANQLCSRLKSVGGSCLVSRN